MKAKPRGPKYPTLVARGGMMLAATLLFAAAAPVAGEDKHSSCDVLRRACTQLDAPDTPGAMYCAGLVQGVLDTHEAMAGLHTLDEMDKRGVPQTEKRFLKEDQGNPQRVFCQPSNSTTGQMARVTAKWIDAHPENLHFPAGGCVFMALMDAFPCTGKDRPK